MIRLTVLYTLPEGQSEESFLEWRLSEHQESNASMPGVIRTDFARITDQWPVDAAPMYQFQTSVEWADRESFTASFYREDVQADLAKNLKRLGTYTFLVTEILADSATA